MNEYDRLKDAVGEFHVLSHFTDADDNITEMCEQLFAEYLMEAGMIPEMFYLEEYTKELAFVNVFYSDGRSQHYSDKKPRYWK